MSSLWLVKDKYCKCNHVSCKDMLICQVRDVRMHTLPPEDAAALQSIKRILGKVQEMRDQRGSLEKQLRDLIQQDDITTALVTTERAEMKVVQRYLDSSDSSDPPPTAVEHTGPLGHFHFK